MEGGEPQGRSLSAPAFSLNASTRQGGGEGAEMENMGGDPVKSPMVGTVYLQPNPGSPAFVKVGDTVEAGQTLFIIEAMKTMNPVPAPRAGKIVQVLIDDAQPVEFGEPLAIIE